MRKLLSWSSSVDISEDFFLSHYDYDDYYYGKEKEEVHSKIETLKTLLAVNPTLLEKYENLLKKIVATFSQHSSSSSNNLSTLKSHLSQLTADINNLSEELQHLSSSDIFPSTSEEKAILSSSLFLLSLLQQKQMKVSLQYQRLILVQSSNHCEDLLKYWKNELMIRRNQQKTSFFLSSLVSSVSSVKRSVCSFCCSSTFYSSSSFTSADSTCASAVDSSLSLSLPSIQEDPSLSIILQKIDFLENLLNTFYIHLGNIQLHLADERTKRQRTQDTEKENEQWLKKGVSISTKIVEIFSSLHSSNDTISNLSQHLSESCCHLDSPVMTSSTPTYSSIPGSSSASSPSWSSASSLTSLSVPPSLSSESPLSSSLFSSSFWKKRMSLALITTENHQKPAKLSPVIDPKEEPSQTIESLSSTTTLVQLRQQFHTFNESSSLTSSLFSHSSNFSSFLASHDLEKSVFHFSSLYSFFHPSHLIRAAFWINVIVMIIMISKKAGNDATAGGYLPWWNLEFLKKTFHDFIERRIVTPARK
jgi:hypothetical protein